MNMKTVNALEPGTNLSDLLSLVAAGTEILLTDGKSPIARLSPIGETTRSAGLHFGAIETTEDFDAPLPDDFWLGRP